VSTWATNPITGTPGFELVAGIVAMTMPLSSRNASAIPSAFSSSTSTSSSTSCFAVLGTEGEAGSDCVSYVT